MTVLYLTLERSIRSGAEPHIACLTTVIWVYAIIALTTLGIRKLAAMITYNDFEQVDIRVGRIINIEDFPQARKPAYKLTIDFGPEIGIKRSSAQITNYTKEELLGKQVIAVVNFPPRQIGPFLSEVLTLGVPDGNGNVILLIPTKEVPLGGKMF